MTHPQEQNSEWIEHDGVKRPVPADAIGFWLMLESFEPTHWQPLPEAPKGE